MIYREAGQFKTSYAADQAIFPIAQDRWFVIGVLVLAFVVPPLTGSQYLLGPILTQFLVFGLAALGLNILVGYAGQISLGTGGFMAVGAYASYNLALRIPELPLIADFLLAGVGAALVGVLFGLPSLRIKGFYLAVATLAAQFFLLWLFDHVPWFTNYDPAGVASAPTRTLLGSLAEEGGLLEFLAPVNVLVSGPNATVETKYLVTLSVVVALALVAKNLVRSATGRAWMAIRDMDIAAEIIGIRPLRTKLLAFAISSFYCGVAGALYVFTYVGNADTEAFDLIRSFQILFMVIIGGLGSIMGSFLGAAFIVLFPVVLNILASTFGDGTLPSDTRFNATIGRLVALWGFHTSDYPIKGPPPSASDIRALIMRKPSSNDIEIKGNQVRSANPWVQLDFGGIAKGYAVDVASSLLRQLGVQNAIVNAGGDLRAFGQNRSRPWKIAIENPLGGQIGGIAICQDESVFTSGNYLRFLDTEEDERYSHILDPRTGWPAQSIMSATVITDTGWKADAAATALIVAGKHDWVEVAKALQLDKVLVTDKGGRIFVTPEMKKRLLPVKGLEFIVVEA